MKIKKRRLGKAFPDELNRISSKSVIFRKDKGLNPGDWEDSFLPNYQALVLSKTVSSWRLLVLLFVFLVTNFFLFLRLFHIQVVNGVKNRELADSNRVQIRVIHAPRGVIYDRNGKVLAENNPGFRLHGKFLTRDEALKLEVSNSKDFNDLETDTIRSYPDGVFASHILGYVGEISQKELSELSGIPYKSGDRIGRSGIESGYEKVLKGVDGAEVVEVDAQGKKLRSLRRIDPMPGSNIFLSVDASLQKIAYEALKKNIEKVGSCCGSLIAEDPKSGEILTLVSIPSFDSNTFNDPQKASDTENYFSDSSSPLLNRSIAGTYPPGSTFKIVTALAGLSSGQITATTQIEDTGVVYLGSFSFANWYFSEYGKKEGMVDVVKAIQRSNDIFFYRVGERVGVDKLSQVAKKMGLGKKLGIDIPGEVDGLIPDDNWKRKNTGEGWYPGDSLHMAIGQGFILVTPLQILAETSFIADGGRLIQPHLVTKITSSKGEVIQTIKYEPIIHDLFSPADIDTVRKGLELVPKSGGTAWPFFNFSIPTAGKTGTAEFGDHKGRTHAWYTSYAPAQNPQVAMTVLIEGGGEGSNASAPVAKEIYRWFFSPDKNNLIKDVNLQATDSGKILGE